MKALILITMLMLIGCNQSEPPKPEPTPPPVNKPQESDCKESGKELTLYATYYYSPMFESSSTGIPIRDMSGNPLGPKLKAKEWCSLAMEGSGSVDGQMYNYAGTTSSHYVDCSAYFDHKPSGRVKFKKTSSKYGLGVKNYHLIPYKSIAVDSRQSPIPYGSTIFIPSAKGVSYEFEGKTYIHDGCFIAHDTGGKIKGNHIDVFIGPQLGKPKNPFSFIKSTPSGIFKAYLN